MRLIFISLLFVSFASHGQCISYKLSANGDTLNCIDKNNLKQGKWVARFDNVRGEPGYEEEGVYVEGKKEGVWRLYTLMGDLFAIERYRWGNKDGISQYFSIAGLTREESWKAVNPTNPYDTIEVPDPVNPNKVQMKVIKIEGTALKHGKWKYYDAATGGLIKTENWFLDKLEDPFKDKTSTAVAGNTDEENADETAKKPAQKPKPKEVMDFEKKVGKKKVKVIDGRTY